MPSPDIHLTGDAADASIPAQERAAERAELATGLERAAQVAWRWLLDDESPWEREITLKMVARLSQSARELREHLTGKGNEDG